MIVYKMCKFIVNKSFMKDHFIIKWVIGINKYIMLTY